jgi:hypothetical protein
MEGYCSTGQSPQRAVVPVEEEEDIMTGLLKRVCMTGLENHLYMNIYLMLSQFGSWIPYPKC